MAQDRQCAGQRLLSAEKLQRFILKLLFFTEKSPRAQILQNPIIKIFETARNLLNHQVRTAIIFPTPLAWASFETEAWPCALLPQRSLEKARPDAEAGRAAGGGQVGTEMWGGRCPAQHRRSPGRHPDMLASRGAPWGVLLLAFGREKRGGMRSP